MKHNIMLTITSLLSILFGTFHLADDIVRGFEKGGVSNLTAVPICVVSHSRTAAARSGLVSNLTAVPICVVWLYGTLVLAERRSGYIILLLGSLLSLAVPVVHMKGKGVGVNSSIAHSSGHFFFVWTLIALGVTALFSVILSVRGLWSLPWHRPR